MKICFFLQRNFAVIGDLLAEILLDEYGVKEFCGYVSTRSSFRYLKEHSKINYSSLVLDEDIFKEYKNEKLDLNFLKEIEQKYGMPNIGEILQSDRILTKSQLIREYPYEKPLFEYEDLLRIVQTKAKAIIHFLETEKPDVIFFSVVGSLESMLLYSVAKGMNIRTLNTFPTLIKNGQIMSGRHDHFTGADFNFPHKIAVTKWQKAAKDFIDDFRKTPRPYNPDFSPEKQQVNRSRQLAFLLPKNAYRSVRDIIRQLIRYYTTEDRYDFSTINPWFAFYDRLLRKIRNLRGVSDLYDKADLKEKFAFFPLQYEPEISLIMQAPYMTDQIYAAKLIARSLPIGWKLYVKEHPKMVEFRPRRFYKELKKIPSIKLINPAVTSIPLIQNAGLITVITGSAAWEATLLGKPVVTLGNQFFNDLSFVKHCDNHQELPYLIKNQIEKFTYDEKELINFIALIMEHSIGVDFQDIWLKEMPREKKKEGLEPFVKLLWNYLSPKQSFQPISQTNTDSS